MLLYYNIFLTVCLIIELWGNSVGQAVPGHQDIILTIFINMGKIFANISKSRQINETKRILL